MPDPHVHWAVQTPAREEDLVLCWPPHWEPSTLHRPAVAEVVWLAAGWSWSNRIRTGSTTCCCPATAVTQARRAVMWVEDPRIAGPALLHRADTWVIYPVLLCNLNTAVLWQPVFHPFFQKKDCVTAGRTDGNQHSHYLLHFSSWALFASQSCIFFMEAWGHPQGSLRFSGASSWQ